MLKVRIYAEATLDGREGKGREGREWDGWWVRCVPVSFSSQHVYRLATPGGSSTCDALHLILVHFFLSNYFEEWAFPGGRLINVERTSHTTRILCLYSTSG